MHTQFYVGSKSLLLPFVLLLGLLLSVAALAAPEAIGTLAESRGKVEINGAAVTPGAELRLGMRVATGSSSQAVLKFADGQTVVVGPESVFWIKNYRYAGNKPQENRFSSELVQGGMRFISGALAKETPQAVEIDTPVATIGVRGTDFTAVLGSLCLMVREGRVVVTSGGQSIVAEPGQILFVQDKLTPPRFIPAPELRAPCAVIQDSATAPPQATASCACGTLTRQNASGIYEFSLPAGGAGAGAGAGAGGGGAGAGAGAGGSGAGAGAGGAGAGAGAAAAGAEASAGAASAGAASAGAASAGAASAGAASAGAASAAVASGITLGGVTIGTTTAIVAGVAAAAAVGVAVENNNNKDNPPASP